VWKRLSDRLSPSAILENDLAKIYILDIETSPNIAYVWRFFKENIGAKQVLENSEILSFAIKELGSKVTTYYDRNEVGSEKFLIELLCVFLDDADVIVAHNGDKFDLPYIQGRCLALDIKPPSPYKTIDTFKSAKYEFKFPSNSLEYLSKVLLGEEKGGHKKFPGFELWLEVLKNNPEAWEEMKEYNIRDVELLEKIYLKMRPFIRNHPNIAVYGEEDKAVCPKCNSEHIQYRGYAHTNVGRYHRFQCNDCGGWGRTRFNIKPNKNLIVNAVN
jgi:hypothetical protein